MLDGHPSLAVLPSDTRIWPVLMDRVLSRTVVRAASVLDVPAITSVLALPGLRHLAFGDRRALERRLLRWVEDVPHVRSGARECAVRTARGAAMGASCWDAFFEVFFELAGPGMGSRPVRVEKTPSNELLVPLLDRFFGARTRYVHVVRDPRSVVASWIAMRRPSAHRRWGAILDRCVDWSRSAHRARSGPATRVGRYHALRYEDLVARPERLMAGVASFLQVPWDDTLLVPTCLGTPAAPNSSWEAVRGGAAGMLVATQSRRFYEVLDEEEIARIERLLGPQMEAWGYACAVEVRRGGRVGGRPGAAALAKGFELARRQRGARRAGRRSADRT